jgi:CPA2 family monovalent cation:H+ antiporter-2
MHQLPLLTNIAVALVAALLGGALARWVGLPTIVGYMVAGIAIGPFTPGFVGDVDTLQQLAELGVIFLMFGVGLHFSFGDLWRVRAVAVPGALAQTTISTALAVAVTQAWGWSLANSLVLGLAISVASTVVLIRGLMDRGLLETSHGHVAVGWLVFEDILTILIIVLLPILAPTNDGFQLSALAITLLKVIAFGVLVVLVGTRLIPWILLRIAHWGSRELFILAVLVLSLGTALGAAAVFDVSLALGAFVAGVVVRESPLSHQVSADLLPFREAFSVLFFVSIGMLVDLPYVADNYPVVLSIFALVVLGKYLITVLLGFVLRHPARTFFVVAAGLSQIGEFSFILGQAAVSIGLLGDDEYSLVVAVALLSIMVNPLMYALTGRLEALLRRWPAVWKALDRHGPAPPPPEETLAGHVVVVGYGRIGRTVVDALQTAEVPTLVIGSDSNYLERLSPAGISVLYADASNSTVLEHAALRKAKALVITLSEEAAAELYAAAALELAPDLPILARARTRSGTQNLHEVGIHRVVSVEYEGALQLVRHLLLLIDIPAAQVDAYVGETCESIYGDRSSCS